MSEKQDRSGVRTAADLERKYNLSSLATLKKAVEVNADGLNKTNAELEQFVEVTTEEIENLQEQIDGKIETWFYSGVPTLSNAPAVSWTTDEEKNNHLGDLYYDTSTGKAYRFALSSNVYQWLVITDTDVTQALAIANAAKDTADSKRQVFVAQPAPPYDNGDLWVDNGDIYICQISKGSSETYASGDFVLATKYTDDTYAKQVGDNLTVLQGTVLEVSKSVDDYKIEFNTKITTIQNETKEATEALETMSYSFGTKDLVIANSNDPVNARINNQGMKIYSYSNLENIVNQKGSGMNKLIVIGDSQIANVRIVKAIDENNNACTDFHHLISNIQSLHDLE